MNQSKGYIDIQSEEGHGTKITLCFPRTAESEAAAAALNFLTQEDGLSGQETILVVEDAPALRELIVQTLGQQGYHVLEAPDGPTALEICGNHRGPIHLLVTDVVMPQMGGLKLAKEVNRVKQGVRVLYISGYTPNAIVHHGILDPGVELLEKPFTPGDLTRRVREVLGPVRAAASILVVEDDEAIRRFFRSVLEKAGYGVREAADGREARRLFAEHGADLLITDLTMPGEEGLESIRAMRLGNPALKILAVSGAFGGQFLAVARKLGANETLQKPVQPNALLETVGRLLNLRRSAAPTS